MDGGVVPLLGPYTRNKSEMIAGTSARFNDTSTEDSFVRESIRGMGDICRQQLSQGLIGDMSRVAKVVSSCFYRPVGGGLYIASRTGPRLLRDDHAHDAGIPALRAMSLISGCAQQAALDAHRATSTNSSSHDFIADLLLGPIRDVFQAGTWEYTYVELSGMDQSNLNGPWLRWKYSASGVTKCLINPKQAPVCIFARVVAAYNPVVLAAVEEMNRVKVVERGILTVCNYYGIRLTEVEATDVVQMYVYRVGDSDYPITSRPGLLARELNWIETLLATDYTKIGLMVGARAHPNTPLSSMFMSNFNVVAQYKDLPGAPSGRPSEVLGARRAPQ